MDGLVSQKILVTDALSPTQTAIRTVFKKVETNQKGEHRMSLLCFDTIQIQT